MSKNICLSRIFILYLIYFQTSFIFHRNKNIEFDFMDEDVVPTMRVRMQNTKGSKKKATNFESVMDAVKKNKRSTLLKE